MALTPAEKQKRYRERRKEAEQANPDAVERALLEEVERRELGEMSEEERLALADRCADIASNLLIRSRHLSRIAFRLQTGSDHPTDR